MVRLSISLKLLTPRFLPACAAFLLLESTICPSIYASESAAAAKPSSTAKADASSTLKMEKPMVDSSTPVAPASAPEQRQSPSGYFIPPDVVNSGAANAGAQGNASGYGGMPQQNSVPAFPNENSIPSFGKPLPAVPASMNDPGQTGQGWASGQPSSGDEERVARLEKSVLGSTYPEHDVDDRVEHLEEELFKSKGSGPMEARIKKMELSVFGQSAAFGGGSLAAPSGAASPPSIPSQNIPGNPITGMGNTNTASVGPPAASTSNSTHAPYEMSPYPSSNLPASGAPNIYGTPSGAPNTSGAPSMSVTPNTYGAPNMSGGQTNYGRPNNYGAQPPYGATPGSNNQIYSGLPNLPNGAINRPPGGNLQPPSFPNQSTFVHQQPGAYQNPNYAGRNPGGYPNQPSQPNQSRPAAGYPQQMPQAGYPPNSQGYPGRAPYAPPGGQSQYGAQQQPYGVRPGNYPPGAPYRPVNTTGNSLPGYPYGSSGGAAPQMPPSYQTDSESQKIANLIPSDAPVGDYYVGVRKFQTGNVARWQHFPVLIHLPPNSPELWRKNLNEDVKKWSAYVPMKTAADYESFVIDVKWENKLPPGVFGITRIEGSGAGLKVIIFLLRPTFYPTDVPESTLQSVFLHELGHGIGLLGHSTDKNDVMYCDEKLVKKVAPAVNTISRRDLNTLKRVYSTAPISDSYIIQPPLEYTSH